jgi:starch phosphorylase
MWEHVPDAAPIVAITNGVHRGTWQAETVRAAGDDPEALWSAHRALKAELGAEVARRTGVTLDRDALWIGFARRAAAYKRGDLLLRDAERLRRFCAEHRVAFLLAGKAHPDDPVGKDIVARMSRAQREHPGHVVFLENHEIGLARHLTRGCDVWLNHPIRPLEACGTSGMKAAMNGVPHLSILDGWWAEGCEHGVNGWAIPGGQAGEDDADAAATFAILEGEVLPAWRDAGRWRALMAGAIASGVTRFSAERMVREYFARLYDGAAAPAATRP